MHDLDRTLQEFEAGIDALETDGFELEGEWGQEMGEYDGEYEQEYGDTEAVFDEIEEMELAAALLEVQDEEELEQFLGGLIKKVGRAVGKVVRGPVGNALGGVLQRVAKTALPMAGAALGNLVVPGVGGVVGGKLASMAGKMFGLELEGLSPQDQEFEVARRVVRLTAEAAKRAAAAPATAAPAVVAKNAVLQAARKHAPGLVGGAAAAAALAAGNGGRIGRVGGRTGRWFRRGRRIVLVGV
ncbi:MAG TPA: hypothetical protein VF192_04875 [Longimicrobiales bacterium]